MDARRRFVTCLAVVAVALEPSVASAVCGETTLVVASAEVTIEPPTPCLEAEVVGQEQGGCDDIRLAITNGCDEVLDVDDRGFYCEIDGSPEGCSGIEPGGQGRVYAPETIGPGDNAFDVPATLGEASVVFRVSFVGEAAADDDGGGCAASPGAPSCGAAVALGLACVAAWGGHRRGRRRARG